MDCGRPRRSIEVKAGEGTWPVHLAPRDSGRLDSGWEEEGGGKITVVE